MERVADLARALAVVRRDVAGMASLGRMLQRARLPHATLPLSALLLAFTAAAPARAADPSPPLRAGIWVTPAELQRLPVGGPAWARLKQLADDKLGKANLSGKNNQTDIKTLAAALVHARIGAARYGQKAAAGIMAAIGTEAGGRTLGLARGLQSYVIAADLIDLKRLDPGKDRVFRQWLRAVRTEDLRPKDNPTLIATHELRPNNWGAHAGASRVAADVFLGDKRDLARAAAVFKGYLGDRAIYRSFRYGDLSWQVDPDAPVGVDPVNARREGDAIDGALPDDMRRGCRLKFPPCPTGYPWEALQGAVVQAEILSRQGYDAWRWGDKALLRAVHFLYDLSRRYPDDGWWASGDDAWIPWLINARYGTRFPTQTPAQPGKGMGFADWTHAGPRACHRATCDDPRRPLRSVTALAGPTQHTPTQANRGNGQNRHGAKPGGRGQERSGRKGGQADSAAIELPALIAALALVLALLARRRSRRRRRSGAGSARRTR